MKLVKRKKFASQRSKPWHIIKDENGHPAHVWCGSYNFFLPSPENQFVQYAVAEFLCYHIVVDSLPTGQILCSSCEKLAEALIPQEN